MGLGAAVGNPKIIDSAVEDMRAHLRPEAGGDPRPQVDRDVQAAREPPHRRDGHAARRAHVGVRRPADRASPCPRVRDFKGVSTKGFDGKGNYTMGLREQIIFPEIDYDKIDVVKGMNISFVTTARTDEEGRALLAELGIPFRH